MGGVLAIIHCMKAASSTCRNLKLNSEKNTLFDLCPVHLPGQNIFCPGQNIFCPGQNIFCTGQNNFCPRQNIFVPDKNFCPRLKSSYLLGKRIENDFKLWRNFFPWLKSYFPSISQAKMYFLA